MTHQRQNWTGSIIATAINPTGVSTFDNISLSNFAESARYRTEGAISYEKNNDTPDIDFIQTIGGRIETDDGSAAVVCDVAGLAGCYAFR